jgi:hypothetical protein
MESQSSGPMTDEQIFNWEYLESLKKEPIIGSPDYVQYQYYKNLK